MIWSLRLLLLYKIFSHLSIACSRFLLSVAACYWLNWGELLVDPWGLTGSLNLICEKDCIWTHNWEPSTNLYLLCLRCRSKDRERTEHLIHIWLHSHSIRGAQNPNRNFSFRWTFLGRELLVTECLCTKTSEMEAVKMNKKFPDLPPQNNGEIAILELLQGFRSRNLQCCKVKRLLHMGISPTTVLSY